MYDPTTTKLYKNVKDEITIILKINFCGRIPSYHNNIHAASESVKNNWRLSEDYMQLQ